MQGFAEHECRVDIVGNRSTTVVESGARSLRRARLLAMQPLMGSLAAESTRGSSRLARPAGHVHVSTPRGVACWSARGHTHARPTVDDAVGVLCQERQAEHVPVRIRFVESLRRAQHKRFHSRKAAQEAEVRNVKHTCFVADDANDVRQNHHDDEGQHDEAHKRSDHG